MILGLLGGIGSGKSTVARMLAAEGAVVIDADDWAHEALEEPQARAELRSWLGGAAFGSDGRVDRRRVAEEVFRTPEALERLERIVHPPVLARIRAAMREHRSLQRESAPTPDELLVLDVPLLAETSLDRECDEILLVESTPELRQRRTRERGWTTEDLARRERRQLPVAEKRRLATRSIRNDGDLESTRRQVRSLVRELRTRESAPAGPAAGGGDPG